MKRLALIALFLLAPLALAKAPVPVNLPPCVAIDGLRMTHVVKGSPQIFYFNIFRARKYLTMKRKARSLVEKLAVADQPAVTIKKAAVVKKKALRKKVGKVKGCKPGRTKNSKGQCGRWKT
jgi:hypothetical protein